MPKRICTLLIVAIVALAMAQSVAQAPARFDSGLQIEVRDVSVLPHLGARYKTMEAIANVEYQRWQMDVGSMIAQQVVKSPLRHGSKWIELLVMARNTGEKDEKLRFAAPRLQLPSGDEVRPWEFIVSGMGDYGSIARALQLSEGPQTTVVHLVFSGNLSCNLEIMQQTWMILIFAVHESAQGGTFSMSGYPPVSIAIPETN